MANIMLKLKIDPNLVGIQFLLQISMLTLWVIIAIFVISNNGLPSKMANKMITNER